MRASFLLAGLMVGCGSSSTVPATTPVTTATGTPEATEPAPGEPSVARSAYELHEWGVVDVPSDGSAVELAAGAGRIDRPMSVRKPVIYVHLLDGATEATFGLRVSMSAGSFVEHFPPATLAGTTLEWSTVVARAAHTPAGPASARRAPPPCLVPDGVCEVSDLPRYDAPSSAGLEVGGEQTGLLFYRSAIPSVALPLAATRGADLTVHVTAATSMADAPGSIWRVSTAMSGPWPVGRMVLSRAAFPAPGASVDLAVGTTAITRDEGAAELTPALASLGLTPDEITAFMAGWQDELFGAETSARETRDLVGPRHQDILIYFLPPADVSAISTLTTTPPARRIRRAFLVRIDLGAVATG